LPLSAGCPKGPGLRVAFSLGYFSFGEAKAKVTSRRATPGSGTQINTKRQSENAIKSIATRARIHWAKSNFDQFSKL
jgi:hypothetical protein